MLTLPIKKEWFDKIKSGEKTTEYREAKPYWHKRFENVFINSKIQLKNGYQKNSPVITIIVKDIELVRGCDEQKYLDPHKTYFAIRIKKVLEN